MNYVNPFERNKSNFSTCNTLGAVSWGSTESINKTVGAWVTLCGSTRTLRTIVACHALTSLRAHWGGCGWVANTVVTWELDERIQHWFSLCSKLNNLNSIFHVNNFTILPEEARGGERPSRYIIYTTETYTTNQHKNSTIIFHKILLSKSYV